MLTGVGGAFVEFLGAEGAGEADGAGTGEILKVGAWGADGAVLAVVAATRVELHLTSLSRKSGRTLAREGRPLLRADAAVLARIRFARVYRLLQ